MHNLGPKTAPKEVKLDDNGVDTEGIRQGLPGSILNEGHQEAKANEHHDIDILVTGIEPNICSGSGSDGGRVISMDLVEESVENQDREFEKDKKDDEALVVFPEFLI